MSQAAPYQYQVWTLGEGQARRHDGRAGRLHIHEPTGMSKRMLQANLRGVDQFR